MKYSLTVGGVLVMIVGSVLVDQLGFSQTCSDELITKVPVILGAAMAYIGRLRQGDITFLGFKKA